MSKKTDLSNFDIFQTEEKVIVDIQTLFEKISNDSLKEDSSFELIVISKLHELFEEYKKLYKNTKRMMRMSDKREGEVRKLNSQMNEKNKLLDILTSKLSRYISPQLAQTICSGKQDVKLESTRKKLTIFFSDIVSFSDFADQMESEDLTDLLNYYMDEMTKIALEYGATIDKYIGDAIMIFFGDPTSLGTKEDAVQCIKMSLAMQNRLTQLRRDESGKFNEFYSIRIGIHTGYCTVGNFGSENRMDYTIIGNSVNIASRLESNATVNSILISEDTYKLVQHEIYCEKVDRIKLKGLSQPMNTYKVVDLHVNRKEKKNLVNKYFFDSNSSVFMNTDQLNKEELSQTIVQLEEILSKLKQKK